MNLFKYNTMMLLVLLSGLCITSFANATISAPTLAPSVGHRPTLKIGLRINGGPNLIQQDAKGKISLAGPVPTITENDLIEYHGIYSDIDGDVERNFQTIGNLLMLSMWDCPYKPNDWLGLGPSEIPRSQKEFDKSVFLPEYIKDNRVRLVGCEVFIGKRYGESEKNPSGYTTNPFRGLHTKDDGPVDREGSISLGRISGSAP